MVILKKFDLLLNNEKKIQYQILLSIYLLKLVMQNLRIPTQKLRTLYAEFAYTPTQKLRTIRLYYKIRNKIRYKTM